MTGPKVQIGVGWTEEGGQIPAEAAGKLQQLQGALQRLDAREPALAMRSLRFAIDDMAVSATGLSGPGGAFVRLAATLGSFGVGLPTMAAAIGGFAALAAVIKGQDEILKNLNTTLTETEQVLASGIPAAMERLRGIKIQDQLASLQAERTGDIQRILHGFPGRTGADAEAMFMRTAQGVSITAQIENLERANARIQQDADKLRNRAGGGKRGRTPGAASAMDDLIGIGAMLPEGDLDAMGLGDIPAGVSDEQATERLARQREEASRKREEQMRKAEEAARHQLTEQGHVLRRLGPAAGALLGLAGATKRGGGVGELVSAAGGAVAEIPGGQIAGAGLEAGGAVLKLLTSGEARMKITEYEQKALDQMKEVMQVTGSSSVNVVSPGGAGLRNTIVALNRASRLDATPMLPVP